MSHPCDEPTDPNPRVGRLRSGVDYELEELADRLLAQAKRDREVSDEYDVLSPGQLDRRRSREIYNAEGTPEPHLYSGLYRRAYNPKIHDRPKKNGREHDA